MIYRILHFVLVSFGNDCGMVTSLGGSEERETERAPLCWFTQQVSTGATAGTFQHQEPGDSVQVSYRGGRNQTP